MLFIPFFLLLCGCARTGGNAGLPFESAGPPSDRESFSADPDSTPALESPFADPDSTPALESPSADPGSQPAQAALSSPVPALFPEPVFPHAFVAYVENLIFSAL